MEVFFMALILCPKCKREVSDKAHHCPHCGNPLNIPPIAQEQKNDVPKPKIYGNAKKKALKPLRNQRFSLAPQEGLEPTTLRLTAK
ncbi:MAG: zinc ribbon domain-containing protein [Clostridia bacterium]|nr:zinc ribbon domain-containing protein [Clostridia bacterium]MBR4539140.1 zinc ribbon domain-containing protein [Clostridia bacterium]